MGCGLWGGGRGGYIARIVKCKCNAWLITFICALFADALYK